MPPYMTALGHAHLKVRDLRRSIAFYTRFFDLRVVEQVGEQYVFLSGGALHHELALQQVGPDAAGPQRQAVGLYHIAFEVPDKRSFGLAWRELNAAEIPVTAVDHRISWAMYFNDPDGNGLEIYCDTRHLPDGVELWQGEDRLLTDEMIRHALAS
jgi:catechol 2,3-dioxygenase